MSLLFFKQANQVALKQPQDFGPCRRKSLAGMPTKLGLVVFVLAAIFVIAACDSQPLIFQENFNKPKKFKKQWEVINGQWSVAGNTATGVQNSDWAIMLARKKLPDDFILTFAAKVEPGSILFEVLLGFRQEKYLGVYVYEVENRIAVEDRSLFSGEQYLKQGTYIRSTGNIGMLPRQPFAFNNEWMVWKIQKAGDQVFVWINNEPVMGYHDTRGLLQPNGRFGFAIKGTGQIQNVRLYDAKDEPAPTAAEFETLASRERERPFFLFSE